MAHPKPTVRTLARALKLSRSTVSNALRGLPGVKEETRRRVQQAAEESGYIRHPFAAEVMSQLRRGAAAKMVGTLAVLELVEAGRLQGAATYNRLLMEGVERRAAQMGFAASHMAFGGGQEPDLPRLNQVLEWRGIHGVVLLPVWGEPDFTGLDWNRLTGVYLDYMVARPPVHTVSTDHFRTLFTALDKARVLGYRRPGLALVRRSDERLNGRWTGAFLSYLQGHPEMTPAPPLMVDDFRADDFLAWFGAHQPDVVITHWIDAPRHMTAAGADIPRTHGYICLNVLPAPPGHTGFDLMPGLLGARAAELVIGQLARNERGVPDAPSNTVMPPRWIRGTTLAARV